MSIESRRERRFIVRVGRGESVLAALSEQVRELEVSLGHVSGFGVLRSVKLDLPTAAGGRTGAYALEGPFEILAVSGRVRGVDEISVDLAMQLARATDAGLSCVGGRVLDAIAEDVELSVVSFDETVKRREPVRAPAAPTSWAAVAAASEEAEKDEELRASWAAVAAASERAETKAARVAPPEGGYVPARGEYIEHKVFGICRVEAVKPDGTMIVKLETGRRKPLKLDAFEVLPPRQGTERVIYPVRIRR